MFKNKKYSISQLRLIIFLWILSGILFKLEGNIWASILFLAGGYVWILRLIKQEKKIKDDTSEID